MAFWRYSFVWEFNSRSSSRLSRASNGTVEVSNSNRVNCDSPIRQILWRYFLQKEKKSTDCTDRQQSKMLAIKPKATLANWPIYPERQPMAINRRLTFLCDRISQAGSPRRKSEDTVHSQYKLIHCVATRRIAPFLTFFNVFSILSNLVKPSCSNRMAQSLKFLQRMAIFGRVRITALWRIWCVNPGGKLRNKRKMFSASSHEQPRNSNTKFVFIKNGQAIFLRSKGQRLKSHGLKFRHFSLSYMGL